MAKLISLKIDVSKIDKSKLFTGQKGTYLDLTVALNDEADQYGNDLSAWQAQTQDERASKAPKNYLGNGKTFWSSGGNTTQNTTTATSQEPDDLPF